MRVREGDAAPCRMPLHDPQHLVYRTPSWRGYVQPQAEVSRCSHDLVVVRRPFSPTSLAPSRTTPSSSTRRRSALLVPQRVSVEVVGALGTWDVANNRVMRRFTSNAYLRLFKRRE
ncbi:hypothetical protein HPB50_021765 [Hyalomma asiaticum]|uniref:Uncharacterized protein n=1 Tax=Hyalomma asiaticum TaxID=266040 RepID=A0ACB7S2U6_HYAAI|nr:hypothetical protein HPB50_021765 [Hyalomma asiaticum]